MKDCTGKCRTNIYQLEAAIDALIRKGVELNKAMECAPRRNQSAGGKRFTPSLCALTDTETRVFARTPPQQHRTPTSIDSPSIIIKQFEYSEMDVPSMASSRSSGGQKSNSANNTACIDEALRLSEQNAHQMLKPEPTSSISITQTVKARKRNTAMHRTADSRIETKFLGGEPNYQKYDLTECTAIVDGTLVSLPAKVRVINQCDGSTLIHYVLCNATGERMVDIKTCIRGETIEELIINGARLK